MHKNSFGDYARLDNKKLPILGALTVRLSNPLNYICFLNKIKQIGF